MNDDPDRVSVGTSYGEIYFVTVIVGSVGWAVAALLAVGFQGQPEVVVGFVMLAGVFALLAFARGYAIGRGRRWFTPTDDGFVLEDRRGTFDFTDEQVSDLATWAKVRFSNGHPKAVVRTGALVIIDQDFSGRLPFKYEYPLNRPDPLDEFLERVIGKLVANAESAVAAGDALQGDGWEYDSAGLTHSDKSAEATYLAADITAAEVVDGKVSVWVRGEAKPVVRVPAGSANALVLLKLLNKQLEARPSRDEDPGEGLGRIIFERDKSISVTVFVVVAVIAAVCVLGGALVAALAFAGPKVETGAVVVAAALIFVPPLILVAMWFNRTNVFRCHSFGVCRVTTRGEKRLRFKDVKVFSYSATRMYVNGAYQGTNVSLVFEPRSGDPGERVVYNAQIKNADDELDNLREHVSRVIASHMMTRLKDGRDVQWTDGVTFTKDGLEINTRGGVFTKGKDLFIPYEDFAHPTLDQGTCYLYEKGRKKAVYQATVSTPNFFPGYILLMALLYPPAPKDDDGDDVPTAFPADED